MSVIDGRPLSNTTGSVLDPIFSLRRRVRLAPAASARVLFSTLVAPSRAEALALAEKYRDLAMFERSATLAWTRAQVQFHHLGSGPDEAHLFQHLANRVLYSDPGLRAPASVLERNRTGAAALWGQGISGDLPIVLVRIDEPEDQGIVRQLLRAHEYWRLRGLAVDLVILNEKAHSYVQDLQTSLESLVRTSQSTLRHEQHETHGSVFVLRADLLSAADRDALRTAARAILLSRHGTLAEQVARAAGTRSGPRRVPRRPPQPETAPETPPVRPELEFFNGLGGFGDGGREYVTLLGTGQWTPAPWLNVVANEDFGFQVSGIGVRLHVVAEQSGEPADALGERSCQRLAGGGDLRPRRRDRRPVGAHGAADPRGGLAVRGAPRAGLQPLRARLTWHRAGAAPVRAARGSRQDLPAHGREPVRPAAPALGHRVRRVDPGELARRLGALHRHRARRGDRRPAGPQRVEPRLRGPRGVPRARHPRDRLERRPERDPGAAREPRPPGRAGARRASVGTCRRRARSVRRAPDHARARGRRAGRGRRSCWARRRRARTPGPSWRGIARRTWTASFAPW